MKTFIKRSIVVGLLSAAVLPLAAHGQTTFSIESVGRQLGLGASDLKQTTLNVIQLILGLITLIAVAMIIVSGFIAATADNEDRAANAKRVITGAVIGLVIILLAWAIVIFALHTTANVTQ